MVTDNEVYIQLISVSNLFHCSNTTIYSYDKRYSFIFCMVNALIRNSITFGVAIGNMSKYLATYAFKIKEKKRYTCSAIHIIVAINHDAFFVLNRFGYGFDCFIHIFHQIGIV